MAVFQIIIPITRLAQESLYQILLIIIEEVANSPLVLMRVSNTVTGICASLDLGTTTSKDAVTRKLERNQSFLDVVVDAEIGRGGFTLSEDATRRCYFCCYGSNRTMAKPRS